MFLLIVFVRVTPTRHFHGRTHVDTTQDRCQIRLCAIGSFIGTIEKVCRSPEIFADCQNNYQSYHVFSGYKLGLNNLKGENYGQAPMMTSGEDDLNVEREEERDGIEEFEERDCF